MNSLTSQGLIRKTPGISEIKALEDKLETMDTLIKRRFYESKPSNADNQKEMKEKIRISSTF